jgi:hypothetical protein
VRSGDILEAMRDQTPVQIVWLIRHLEIVHVPPDYVKQEQN